MRSIFINSRKKDNNKMKKIINLKNDILYFIRYLYTR